MTRSVATKSATEDGAGLQWVAVDGLRALTHISVIALHAAMITTGHLPSKGKLWGDFKGDWLFSVAQAGGIQVDIMFAMSAFLSVYSLLSNDPKKATFKSFLYNRVTRLLPMIVVVSLLGLLLGEDWAPYFTPPQGDKRTPFWMIFLTTYSFIANYVPVAKFGSFTLSLCWSCCVDIHCNIAIYFLMKYGKKYVFSASKDALAFASKIRWVFLLLVLVSFAIRGYLFDKDKLNIFKLGQSSHFGLLMTDSSYNFVKTTYGHEWQTSNSAAAMSLFYYDNMYAPTHTRFGPFAVGAFMACNLFIADKSTPTQKAANTLSSYASIALCWLLTAAALGQLLLPCIPPGDGDVPLEAQFFATAALRTLSSAAMSFLLYRCLLPENSSWHWSFATGVFQALHPLLAPVSRLSFCSYLAHFRLLMEIAYQPVTKRLLLMGSSSDVISEMSAKDWILFMHKLFISGFIASMVLSFFLNKIELYAKNFFADNGVLVEKKRH